MSWNDWRLVPDPNLHPLSRRADSERKIRSPFRLDPTMCFYSPQANQDALDHPRVKAWLEFISEEWEPPASSGRRLALLLPCTKYKPYNTSREHRAINGALLASGWEPEGESPPTPPELFELLEPTEDAALLHIGPLRKGGTSLDRLVVSEPLGLVPYPYLFEWGDQQSPATSYDDPGLFEARGTSVSPERPDSTAVMLPGGSWRWGPNERSAYVMVHNSMAGVIARVLGRIAHRYSAIGAWVSPGLTHRSFLADSEFRRTDSLPRSKRGPQGPLVLTGALDTVPATVTIMPTAEQQSAAREALSERLVREGRPASTGAARAVYARGDGSDTPLGLPEMLTHLTGWLDRMLVD